MVKVSIIMPVYNSEKYLKKAVDSVLSQDFDDFELIIVNDGSTDGSGELCDKYAENYSNVRVVHKENGGICSARNAGLDVARGEYIGFCDNDDIYLPHLIRDNYALAKKYDVDLMRYAKVKYLEKDDGRVREIHIPIQDMFIEKDKFYQYYRNIRREDTVWTAFYRKEIIEQHYLRFDEQFKYGSEDLNFNLHFLMHCERLGFNSNAYYSWTQRESHSTSRRFNRDYLEKNMINMDLEYDFFSEVCQSRVDNVMKNEFLINSYVYPMVDYMDIEAGDMTMSEKVAYLNRMRDHALFDEKIPQETLDEIRKENIRIYITMKLFYERRYKSLIMLLGVGTSFLDRFRFKNR